MMKKSCFLFSLMFALFILPGGKASAQSCEAGMEMGPGLGTMRGNFIVEDVMDPGFGYSGGLFFQWNTSCFLSYRTALLFDRKGTTYRGQVTDDQGNSLGSMTVQNNFNYLTMPLLVRATFGQKVRFFANAGPYFSYLVDHTTVSKGDNMGTIRQDGLAYVNRFDTGLSAGVGCAVPVCTNFSLNFEVRNNLGLSNISALPTINNGTVKHNSTNLLIGLSWSLCKGG